MQEEKKIRENRWNVGNAAKERKLGHAQLYWCVYAAIYFFFAKTAVNCVFWTVAFLTTHKWEMGWVCFCDFHCRLGQQNVIHSSLFRLPAVHELACPWTFFSFSFLFFVVKATLHATDHKHSQTTSFTITQMEIRSSSYTFKQKCVSHFFSFFRESFKLKFLIFSRYFLVEDWLAVSSVRSPRKYFTPVSGQLFGGGSTGLKTFLAFYNLRNSTRDWY